MQTIYWLYKLTTRLSIQKVPVMFKNLTVFRINQFNLTPNDFSKNLGESAFNRCGSHTLVSSGFMPPIGKDNLVHRAGDYLILSFAIEKKLLPASVVKEFVNERVAEITEREGKRPKRKVITSIKEDVIDSLLPKAFGVRKNTLAWIDVKNKWLCIDSTSQSVVDLFTKAFFKCVGGDVSLKLVETNMSPVAAMSDWLLAGEAPDGFLIEQDCLLKNPDSDASLRFSKHPLGDGVASHIAEGKVPSELSLVWNGRVSFTLGANWTVRKIKLLDVTKEGQESIEDEFAAFSADAMLDIGEIVQLLPDLVRAMGGFKE